MIPTLNIVSISIGNPLDISQRAIQVLQTADWIIGEEHKETSRFLHFLQIKKDFELLNEHSKEEEIFKLIQKIKSSQSVALISDAGTPLIEDPGLKLVQFALEHKISIQSIPGPSAILTALTLSGFPIIPFTFVGFLNREESKRRTELKKYLSLRHTLVIYETPYRYKKVLIDLEKVANRNHRIFLGLNLTTKEEIQIRGNIKDVLKKLDSLPKALPVIVIN